MRVCMASCVSRVGFVWVESVFIIVSQPSECLKFMTFREGCFVIHVEYKYLSETLETFYHHQFSKDEIRQYQSIR